MKYILYVMICWCVGLSSYEKLEMLAPPVKLVIDKSAEWKGYRIPGLAATFSGLFPGLGQFYVGDYQAAFELLGSVVGLTLVSSRVEQMYSEALTTRMNMWSYGIFAAYRDARIYNGDRGCHYRMPMDSFNDLTYAPFRANVMKKGEVWGGILAFLAAGAVIDYLAFPNNTQRDTSSRLNPACAFPIGIGEEALFRGYLQSHLSEVLTPVWGIAISSVIFTGAHFWNAERLLPNERWRYYAYAMPFIGSFSLYSGWLTYKNHSMQESVAVHSWYDFVMFLANSLSSSSISNKKLQFTTGFAF